MDHTQEFEAFINEWKAAESAKPYDGVVGYVRSMYESAELKAKLAAAALARVIP
jgi:hypothetical protein